MIVVAIIAILAMVAIPAFVKYVRRSKTVEATMNIRKLYDSSVSYFSSERAGRAQGSSIIARRFPYPTLDPDPDPAEQRCCEQPGGKCRMPADYWTTDDQATSPWEALNFSVDEPFYFHYMYSSTGTEGQAMFTAHAFGNLDCDEQWSTYERAGSVDSLFNIVGSGLYINNDIE
jgi:type II secretory pathway pseudopilin PulG